MFLGNESSDRNGIYGNIVLTILQLLKISLRFRLLQHFNVTINDNIIILPNSSACVFTQCVCVCVCVRMCVKIDLKYFATVSVCMSVVLVYLPHIGSD